jgi:hypothetical protein
MLLLTLVGRRGLFFVGLFFLLFMGILFFAGFFFLSTFALVFMEYYFIFLLWLFIFVIKNSIVHEI